jgi:hypothetical protein
MEHQADVHPQLRLILPDAGPGCEKTGRRATWPVTTRSGRHQVPVAVLPTAKSLSAFSLKPQSDRLLGSASAFAQVPVPIRFVEYSAKFLCGDAKDPGAAAVRPGNYETSINIHNPFRGRSSR